jgi:hypothetical protein
MKKILSSLSLILLLSPSLPAQKVVLKNQFPDVHSLTRVLDLGDGYLVAGYRTRSETHNQYMTTYYRPFVSRLDEKMQVVWEKKFTESKYLPIKTILAANDGFYVLGDNGDQKNTGSSWARLTRLSTSGKVEWEKLYPYPGNHSSEGVDLISLPDGDLLARIDVFYQESSIELPHLVRLTRAGAKVWDRPVKGSYFRYYPSRMTLTLSGKVLLSGTALKSADCLRSSESEGWVRAIDPDKPDKTITERLYSEYPCLRFTDAMELESGGWWMLGAASDPGNEGRFYLTLMELDPDLCLVEKRRYNYKSHLFMRSFCWDQKRSQLLVAGQTYTIGQESQTALFTLGLDWDLRENKIGGKGSYSQITTGPDGNILVVDKAGLVVMR